MKTFTSWLVANFEILIGILSLIPWLVIGVDIIKDYEGDIIEPAAGFICSFCIFGLLLVCSLMSLKSFGTSILIFLCLLAFFIVPFDVSSWGTVWTIICVLFGISCLGGILLAVFAAINFDEVTSRRMLYRNSNVSMFEIEALYVINRFCSISSSLFFSIIIMSLAFFVDRDEFLQFLLP